MTLYIYFLIYLINLYIIIIKLYIYYKLFFYNIKKIYKKIKN